MRALPMLFGLAMLAGCNEPAQKAPAVQPRVEGQSIVFPAGSPQVAALILEPAEPRREEVLRLNGRLVWNEDRTVRVFSPLGGRVQSVAARPGDRVRAGQTLALIAAPELGTAQAEARKAEQDDNLARKSLARVAELVEAGVAPAKDLQAAQADAARAAAERERTQARLDLYGAAKGAVDQRYALAAPIAGVVVERNLNAGQELRPDAVSEKSPFVVSDPGRLWYLLDVSEADIAHVRPGARVEIGAVALAGDTVAGRITHVADFVDPQTRTVKVRGEVENGDGRLKAEMFVSAVLRIPATQGVIVPSKAVYLRGEQHYVFVQAGEGRFVRRPVRLGPTGNGHQVVLEGLAAGEQVVVDGNLLLERILASRD